MDRSVTLEISIQSSTSAPGKYDAWMSYETAETVQRSGSFPVALDLKALDALRLQPHAYGAQLGGMLLDPPGLQEFYKRACQETQNQKLRVVLVISQDSPELNELRWEMLTLRDPSRTEALTFNANQPFSRLLASQDWSSVPRRPKGDLRALVLVANPKELARTGGLDLIGAGHSMAVVDVPGELSRALAALKGVEKIDTLAQDPRADKKATFANLITELTRGCDILYLVCHGALLREDPKDSDSQRKPFVLLEEADGSYDIRDAREIVSIIMNQDAALRPRLVVLASCQSGGDGKPSITTAERSGDGLPSLAPAKRGGVGKTVDGGALAAFGPQLAQAGVAAVVAMQDNVQIATVECFMPAFFEVLLQDGRIDAAMAAGRNAARGCPDWWVPVLYTRFKDGQLFGPPKIEDTIKALLSGMAGQAVSYEGRIKNFLDEYLGSTEHPVPFGGRQAQLDALDGWLDNLQAPHYALVAAPAGRGKSALLVHWLRTVQASGKVEVAFVPVSLRFETASEGVVMAALAARLGEIFHEPATGTNLTAGQWREVCLQYLKRPVPVGKQVLVVLDGLDEAAGWEGQTVGGSLLPKDPPEGLRALVTARYLAGDTNQNGWLNRLGWKEDQEARTFQLPPLSEQGVGEVLVKMQAQLPQQLAAQADLASQLYRLSGGDPLLVRLYVDALLPRDGHPALTLEQVSTALPGLEGYIERWWSELQAEGRSPLEEDALLDFLNMAAIALGPLCREDVAAIAGEGPLASGLRQKNAVRAAARLVLGDGRQQGYVYSHPRLGDYFFDEMLEHERRAWEQRFVRYGRETLRVLDSGELRPEHAPAYTLDYYAQHLERAQAAPEEFYALVSEGWIQARYAQTGTYDGFMNDLDKAWGKAEQVAQDLARPEGDRAKALVMQLRCGMCRASINSIVNDLSAELLELALEVDLVSPAQVLAIARENMNPSNQSDILCMLMPKLDDEQKPAALDAAGMIQHGPSRADLMCALSTKLEGKLQERAQDEALEAVRTIPEELYRANNLPNIAPYLSARQMDDVLNLVRVVKDKSLRDDNLVDLAPYLSSIPVETTLTAAGEIGDPWTRMNMLTELAGAYSGEPKARILASALEAVKSVQGADRKVYLLSELAAKFSGADQGRIREEAIKVARRIAKKERFSALRGLAEAFSGTQKESILAEALPAALAIPSAADRVDALCEWAALISATEEGSQSSADHLKQKADVLVEALAAASQVAGENGERAAALLQVAKVQNRPKKNEILMEALAEVEKMGAHDWSRFNHLIALAREFGGTQRDGILAEARNFALAFEEPRRSRLLLALAIETARDKTPVALDQALDMIFAIQDLEEQAGGLKDLCPFLSGDQLITALNKVDVLKDEGQQARLLRRLVPYFSGDQAVRMLGPVRKIADESERIELLCSLAKALDGPQKKEIVREALETARAIQDDDERAAALCGLTSKIGGPQKDLHLNNTLTAARAIKACKARAKALGDLAQEFSEPQRGQVLKEALDAARAIKADRDRARAWWKSADEQVTEDPESKARVLGDLAQKCSEPQRGQLLKEALDTARAIEDKPDRAAALRELAGKISGAQKDFFLKAALAAARAIEDPENKASVLCDLVQEFSEPQRGQVLDEALEAARAIEDPENKASALKNLAQQCIGPKKVQVLKDALTAARRITERENRARVLGELAQQCIGPKKVQVLEAAQKAARSIEEEDTRKDTLDWLNEQVGSTERPAPELPAEKIRNELAEVREYKSDYRATELSNLALRMVEQGIGDKITPFQLFAESIHQAMLRPEYFSSLNAIYPLLFALVPAAYREQVANDVFDAIQETAKWWP